MSQDLTGFFENVFNIADMQKQQYKPQSSGYIPTPQQIQPTQPIEKSYSPQLTPEQRGAQRRQERLQQEKAWLEFLKSITEREYSALQQLSKGNIVISDDELEQIGEQGGDLGISRLEKAEAIKREQIPGEGLTEFRLLIKGRRILDELV